VLLVLVLNWERGRYRLLVVEFERGVEGAADVWVLLMLLLLLTAVIDWEALLLLSELAPDLGLTGLVGDLVV
jgi:hypothetical protein